MNNRLKKNTPKLAFILVITVGLFLFFSFFKTSNNIINNVDSVSNKEEVIENDDIPAEIELSEETKSRINSAKEKGIPSLIISNTEARTGDFALITVNLVNNPGIAGMSLTLSYDDNVVELEKLDNGEAFDNVLEMTASNQLSSGCHIMWDSTDVDENTIRDGVILSMRFRVKDDAAAGKTPIIVIRDLEGTYDKDISVVDMSVENGFITVSP